MSACRAQFDNDLVTTRSSEYDGSLAALYAWDLRYVTVAAGMAPGVTFVHQRFETDGRAPSRLSTAPYLAFVANLSVDLFGATFLRLDGRAATQLVRVRTAPSGEEKLDVLLSLRAALLLGMYFGTAEH